MHHGQSRVRLTQSGEMEETFITAMGNSVDLIRIWQALVIRVHGWEAAAPCIEKAPFAKDITLKNFFGVMKVRPKYED